MSAAAQRVAQAAGRADAIFIPDNADNVPQVVNALQSAGVNLRRVQLLGTGLWDDPRIFAAAPLRDGWYPSPDTSGYNGFVQRYRARYGGDPVRTASLSYDAVALIARLVQTEGPNAFSEQTLVKSVGLCRRRWRVPLPRGWHERTRPGGDESDAAGRRSREPGAALIRAGDLTLRRQIGHDGVEHRKA